MDDLRAKYAEVFGEPTGSRHKDHLVKRIIWRMQANAEGGLSERRSGPGRGTGQRCRPAGHSAAAAQTRRRCADANGNRGDGGASQHRPAARARCSQRQYKGQTVRVIVLADGFEYEGERYKSLTAVAKAVTGKHWNGFHFFGLRKNGGDR